MQARRGAGKPNCTRRGAHGATGYDSKRCRRECRERSVVPCITRRGIESSQRLGRHRWVVERTHAWLNRLRRLAVRHENIHLAFTVLGRALVCLNQIRRFC